MLVCASLEVLLLPWFRTYNAAGRRAVTSAWLPLLRHCSNHRILVGVPLQG